MSSTGAKDEILQNASGMPIEVQGSAGSVEERAAQQPLLIGALRTPLTAQQIGAQALLPTVQNMHVSLDDKLHFPMFALCVLQSHTSTRTFL